MTSRETLPVIKDPPSAKVRDVAMAFLGLVPGVSSFAQLIAGEIWEDPRGAAVKQFAVDLAERLVELENRADIDLPEILARPETRPLLIHAFEAANKSLGDRKMEALKNAAAQGIFERGYAFDLSVMVFSLLDRLTEGHLNILRATQHFNHQYRGHAWPSVSDLSIHDVPVSVTAEGMREPVETIFNGGGFSDNFLVRVNRMLIDDLLNMGLLKSVGGQATGIVSFSSTGPTNVPYSVQFTEKGRLVYEHIFPTDPDL
ncbi:hypothetical protein [Rhizobium sp. BE258]|uniref:hypothetical protein n=1 Tax=Rhizobium sp. BE258 TaxID=2817722 RepID=UPI002862A479|nr:hypothetical protein [Rhizobium sp. BE258]MDR7146171.1 hypothetical protein [Rhizobium sp. BE258]